MKPEEQRIAIAEACGWAEITFTGYRHQGIRPESSKRYCNWNRPAPAIDVDDAREWHWLPDYLNSLDAMHEAEKAKEMHWDQKWVETIVEIALREYAMQFDRTDGWDWVLLVSRLSATQRAEAFLKTINLWTDES